MNYLNPLFFILVTVGPIFIIAGFIMLKFPPKKINYLYGYRTKNSMKNQERWDFAQIFSSKLMIKYGFYLTILSLLGLIFPLNSELATVLGLGLMLLAVAFLLIGTEKAINQKFRN